MRCSESPLGFSYLIRSSRFHGAVGGVAPLMLHKPFNLSITFLPRNCAASCHIAYALIFDDIYARFQINYRMMRPTSALTGLWIAANGLTAQGRPDKVTVALKIQLTTTIYGLIKCWTQIF